MYDSLESMRKKLLDLSTRNALLNYRFPSGKSIRSTFVEPDRISDTLSSGETLSFASVPEPNEKTLIDAGYIQIDDETGEYLKNERPTAEKWAKHLKLNTRYEHTDSGTSQEITDTNAQAPAIKKLQTLMYQDVLDKRLRDVRNNAEAAISDAGANILYLTIGFLEWYESDYSTTKRLAPLINIPVMLTKNKRPDGQGVFRYSIEQKDDQLTSNETLNKKLMQEFNLDLPEMTDEIDPESYFKTIEQTVLKQKPKWKLRRYTVLGLFNFTKQVMYQDINPDNWPKDNPLEAHPVISHLFGKNALSEARQLSGCQKDYAIDQMEQLHQKFPVIYDADTSQHSALIDAVNGDNLVVIGPPGSGKSQTITNLIAALIANKKKVLFVAEKMAALNVVKSRLDKAGLGDFCLELHSHKTNKVKIFEDIKIRLDKRDQFRSSEAINDTIDQCESYKTQLNAYVELINTCWKNTGLKICDILNSAVCLQEQLQLNPEQIAMKGVNGDSLTPVRSATLKDQADMLGDIFFQVAEQAENGDITRHFWYGMNRSGLSDVQQNKLITALESWNDSLQNVKECWKEAACKLEIDYDGMVTLETVQRINEKVGNLPPDADGLIHLFQPLQPHVDHLGTWLTGYKNSHARLIELRQSFKDTAIIDSETMTLIDRIDNFCRAAGIDLRTSLQLFMHAANDVRQLHETASSLEKQLDNIKANVPGELHACFTFTQSGITSFSQLISLIDALPAEDWSYRNDLFDNPSIDPVLRTMTEALERLHPQYEMLSKTFAMKQIPETGQLKGWYTRYKKGGVFRWFSSEWKGACLSIKALAVQHDVSLKSLSDQLPALITYSEGLGALSDEVKQAPWIAALYSGIDTPIDRLNALRRWYQSIREVYGVGFMEKAPIGNALIHLDYSIVQAVQGAAHQGLLVEVQEIAKKTDALRSFFPHWFLKENGTQFLVGRLSGMDAYCTSLAKWINQIAASYELPFSALIEQRTVLAETQRQIADCHEHPVAVIFAEADYFTSMMPGHYNSNQYAHAMSLLSALKIILSEEMLTESLRQNPTQQAYKTIVDLKCLLSEPLEREKQNKALFCEAGDVDAELWEASAGSSIRCLIARNRQALSHPDWIAVWGSYLRLKEKLSSEGAATFIKHLEQEKIPKEKLKDIVRLGFLYPLSMEILEENKILETFSGMEHEAIRKKFRSYDYAIIEQQREVIASQADSDIDLEVGVSSGRVGDYTQMSLIKHNLRLKKPRIAIRQLMDKAGESIMTLKPCFMMSPMSVAQYLAPGKLSFDVVIMDEASQIRPEDALGAIARGMQVVIVGDPKQLPPSNFFRSLDNNDDKDDDEVVGAERTESILEAVQPVFKERLLSWHYRSKHESLIAFSNQRFYDRGLTIFPSPFKNDPAYGIKYQRVDGCFENRRNKEEAHKVVEGLLQQLQRYPDDSIGIVAMNVAQQEEIENEIEVIKQQQPKLIAFLRKNEQSGDPLFIKNLESVQGDERDVIIISMTYGPLSRGCNSMPQRFGPINNDGGWRRLNVLFTRAKKRMLIYSSMDSGFIRPTGTSGRGVVELRNWLQYCETGAVQEFEITGKKADSDFEIAVMKALTKHGYECEPQLGVSGYRLDLAVRHPSQPGHFLMGIECDGASYHSAKSARERDRLRQEVLEGLGWKIRRIWSTDWFRNSGACLQPILNELERLCPIGSEMHERNVMSESDIE